MPYAVSGSPGDSGARKAGLAGGFPRTSMTPQITVNADLQHHEDVFNQIEVAVYIAGFHFWHELRIWRVDVDRHLKGFASGRAKFLDSQAKQLVRGDKLSFVFDSPCIAVVGTDIRDFAVCASLLRAFIL